MRVMNEREMGERELERVGKERTTDELGKRLSGPAVRSLVQGKMQNMYSHEQYELILYCTLFSAR